MPLPQSTYDQDINPACKSEASRIDLRIEAAAAVAAERFIANHIADAIISIC